MKDISILPDECLLEIFSFLKYQELKSACLVCASWNEIISNSSIFLANTKVYVELRKPDTETQQTLSRKYRNIYITLVDSYDPSYKILDDLCSLGFFLKSIVIKFWHDGDFEPTAAQRLIKFLKCCENIEYLAISDLPDLPAMTTSNDENSSDQITFKKLREIILQQSHTWLLGKIKCEQLDLLDIDYEHSEFHDDNYLRSLHKNPDHLINFFNQIERLDILKLYGGANMSSSSNILNPKFKWNEMLIKKIDDSTTLPDSNWGNLCQSASENGILFVDSKQDPDGLRNVLEYLKKLKVRYELDYNRWIDQETVPTLLANVKVWSIQGVFYEMGKYLMPSLKTLKIKKLFPDTGVYFEGIFKTLRKFGEKNKFTLEEIQLTIWMNRKRNKHEKIFAVLLKLYTNMHHVNNFAMVYENVTQADRKAKKKLQIERLTRDEIEMKAFGKILTNEERIKNCEEASDYYSG